MTSTIPTTLTEYQAFVREEALKVQVDMGWPDEKLNATLKALGLPEKLNFYIPVEVTGKMIVVLNVDDALSESEARDKIAELSSEEMGRRIRSSSASVGHFAQLTGVVATLPDKYTVGYPDTTLSNQSIYASTMNRADRRQCEEYRRDSSAYCTLRRGHGGDQHAAGNGTTIVATWPTES